MKTLSLKQPWAVLIAAGIKDIENRAWQPEQTPCRILIHASKSIDAEDVLNMPVEWSQEISNQMKFGNIPDSVGTIEDAIIGYVTVEHIETDLFKNKFKEVGKTLWADFVSDNENMRYWRLADAHVFDEPIPCTGKGEDRFWEYEGIDEGSLPSAQKVEIAKLELDDDKIIVPLSELYWEELEPHSSIDIDITIILANLWGALLMDQGFNRQSFNTITFIHQGQQRTFRMEPDSLVSDICDVHGFSILYPSASNEEGATRQIAHIVWGEEL